MIKEENENWEEVEDLIENLEIMKVEIRQKKNLERLRK